MDTVVAQSLLRPRPSRLLPFVLLSVIGHVGIVVVLLVLSWVLSGPRINLDPTPIKATLVRLGKQRDEKLLPRKEEEPPPPAPEQKAVEVAKPAPPENVVKIPTKDAKDEKKQEKKDGAKDTKKSLFDALNKTARAGKAEDLEGRADGDINGDSAKQEGERYYGLLVSTVKRNYDVSDTIDEATRRTLNSVVAMRLGPNGELLDVDLKKSSGNELFDSAVLAAVKKAAPFGPPPETLREALKKTGVAFNFTP